jgi:hypothetical protein
MSLQTDEQVQYGIEVPNTVGNHLDEKMGIVYGKTPLLKK